MAKAHDAQVFSLETQWRTVVGLGGPNVLETAMTLHHLYGFPTIPGSALKGLTRARALLGMAELLQIPVLAPEDYQRHQPQTPLAQFEAFLVAEDGDDREGAWETLTTNAFLADSPLSDLTMHDLIGFADTFRAIFGSIDRAGAVVFFEGVPENAPRFSLDIMNPHYPDYYGEQSSEPPASYQDPRPVYFLTTASGASFSFAVAPRIPTANEMAQQAGKWLRLGLKTMGIGAKTVAGYGYFA
jgi:CRISPR-associated protein Cmr6